MRDLQAAAPIVVPALPVRTPVTTDSGTPAIGFARHLVQLGDLPGEGGAVDASGGPFAGPAADARRWGAMPPLSVTALAAERTAGAASPFPGVGGALFAGVSGTHGATDTQTDRGDAEDGPAAGNLGPHAGALGALGALAAPVSETVVPTPGAAAAARGAGRDGARIDPTVDTASSPDEAGDGRTKASGRAHGAPDGAPARLLPGSWQQDAGSPARTPTDAAGASGADPRRVASGHTRRTAITPAETEDPQDATDDESAAILPAPPAGLPPLPAMAATAIADRGAGRSTTPAGHDACRPPADALFGAGPASLSEGTSPSSPRADAFAATVDMAGNGATQPEPTREDAAISVRSGADPLQVLRAANEAAVPPPDTAVIRRPRATSADDVVGRASPLIDTAPGKARPEQAATGAVGGPARAYPPRRSDGDVPVAQDATSAVVAHHRAAAPFGAVRSPGVDDREAPVTGPDAQVAASRPISPVPVQPAPAADAAPPMPEPPRQATPTSPAEQVAPALVRLSRGPEGVARLTVRLDPAELGQVEIRIDRAPDQAARVRIVVERPETLLLLLHDQARLSDALDQAGIAAGRDVSFHLAPPPPHPQATAAHPQPTPSADTFGANPGANPGGDTGAGARDGGGMTRPPSAGPPFGADAEVQPHDPPARWLRAGLDITA